MTQLRTSVATRSSRNAFHEIIDKYRPELDFYESTYEDLHQNPELSEQEERTSNIAAEHLRKIGYTIRDCIGGYGVVGVLENGTGPTVLLRADMDGLPVLENTGLSYASKKEMKDRFGHTVPVMHGERLYELHCPAHCIRSSEACFVFSDPISRC